MIDEAPKIKVLFLAADPSDAARLRLGQEFREIQEKLQLARKREQFSLEVRMSVRPGDVTQAILDTEPQIVHFSGHGTSTGDLCLENELGEVHTLHPDALASLFELLSDQVSCVVLNLCYSEIQARAIAAHIGYVIGMRKEIGDEAAIAFSIGFYKALGSGRAVEQAYKFGIVELRMLGILEHLTPVLIKVGTDSKEQADDRKKKALEGSAAKRESRYLEAYKRNFIYEIHNNLVLELYDQLQYEDICITPLVHPKNHSAGQDQGRTLEVVELVQSPRVAILGEPGSGKTTALRKLSLDLLQQDPMIAAPIYISLASFSLDYKQGQTTDFPDYINNELSIYGCPSIDLLTEAGDAKPVLLLDGWDEIYDNEARDNVKRFLARTRFHFIVTSRPEAQRSLPLADRYEVHPLSVERMREFVLRRIPTHVDVEKVVRWLSSDSSMRRLAENPLNLSIMTIVFMEEGDVGRLTKTKLYERAFETIVRQHHRAHPYEGLLSSDEDQTLQLEMILQDTAYQTITSGGGRFFSIRELNRSTTKVLGSVPPGLSELLVGRLGIIRDRRAGRMEFFHLWYQEFLAAKHIVENSEDMLGELSNERLAGVLLYVVGLLPRIRDAFDLLRSVKIHDAFSYCRAIPECEFNGDQIEALLDRVISYGENREPKMPVRMELARALALAGSVAVPSLFSIARDEHKAEYARRSALEALAILPLKKGEFERLLLEMLGTQSLGLLWHVIEHIGNRRISQAQQQLQAYTCHSDPIVVGMSVFALREIQGRQIDLSDDQIEALIACWSTEDKHVQGHTLRTLGLLREARAIPKLKEHLSRRDTGYRTIAPEAASLIGGRGALEVIAQALDDHDPRVVAAALKGITEMDEEISRDMLDKIRPHLSSTVWIAFLEQSLGSIAWAAYQRVFDRTKQETDETKEFA